MPPRSAASTVFLVWRPGPGWGAGYSSSVRRPHHPGRRPVDHHDLSRWNRNEANRPEGGRGCKGTDLTAAAGPPRAPKPRRRERLRRTRGSPRRARRSKASHPLARALLLDRGGRMSHEHRVIIIGGGFGGLRAAKALKERRGRDPDRQTQLSSFSTAALSGRDRLALAGRDRGAAAGAC